MKCHELNREVSHIRGRPAGHDRSNSALAKVPRCAFFVLLCSTWSSSRTIENPHGNFVERCRLDCATQKDPVSCTKYRVIQWLYDVSRKKELSYGPFRLVRMPLPSDESVILSRTSRLRNSGLVVVEALNFARNVAEDLLIRRALVYTVDHSTGARALAGPTILDEEELRELQDGKLNDDQRAILKKKKSIVLPILVLLKLFKLKLLLIPIFLGVHFIKKFLVFASLLAPSILANLKYCKMPPSPYHQQHGSYPYHSWSTAAEAPLDYPTGYGHEDAWNHRSDIQGLQGYGAAGYHGPYAGYFQGHRQ